MAVINNWWGENNIGWGASYQESWWGNVNEANSWGIIYPGTAEGSIIYADSTLFTADSTSYYADNGTADVVISVPVINNSVYFRYPYRIFNSSGNILIQTHFMTLSQVNTYDGSTYQNTYPPSLFAMYTSTGSLEVGAYLFNSLEEIWDSNNTHRTSSNVYTSWADLDDIMYIAFKANGSTDWNTSGTLNLYPLYKVEKQNGYLKITEIIAS